MHAGFRAKYISKLLMNVRAFVRLPLNLGGSPKSPEGVCIAGAAVGAAGGSGPGLRPFQRSVWTVLRMS